MPYNLNGKYFTESYERKIWRTGDVVSAEGLNNMESELSMPTLGCALMAQYDTDTQTLTMTCREILTAIRNGCLVWIVQLGQDDDIENTELTEFNFGLVRGIDNLNGTYTITSDVCSFTCEGIDDYPVAA